MRASRRGAGRWGPASGRVGFGAQPRLEMTVRLTVLGSGSAGNATLLERGDRRVLIDVGLSYREVARRLESIAVPPASIGAVVIIL